MHRLELADRSRNTFITTPAPAQEQDQHVQNGAICARISQGEGREGVFKACDSALRERARDLYEGDEANF